MLFKSLLTAPQKPDHFLAGLFGKCFLAENFESCFGPPVQVSFQDQIENPSNISRGFLEFIFDLPYEGCGKTCFEIHCSQ